MLPLKNLQCQVPTAQFYVGSFSVALEGHRSAAVFMVGAEKERTEPLGLREKPLLTALLVNPPLCPDHGDRGSVIKLDSS